MIGTTPISLAEHFRPMKPMSELPAGFFPTQINIIYIDTKEEQLQYMYDGLKPPYLQSRVYSSLTGWGWI